MVEDTATPWRSSRRAAVNRWLVSPHLLTLPLDLGFIAITVITIFTREVVVGFHTIFVLLAVTALMLPFRGFVIRLAIWTTVEVALIAWAISSLDVPSAELSEIPILTSVLILIFLVAQARSQAAAESSAMMVELQRRTDLEQSGLRQQLEQGQRRELLGRASAGLAHDLRNIFTVIRGSINEVLEDADTLQLARTGSSAVTSTQSLNDVDSAAERGLDIVDQLLWLGRQHDSILEVTDLNSATRQLEPLLRRLTRPSVILRVEVPDDECLVRIDRVGLSQILMNLVSNANDAIVGSGTITVSTRKSITPIGRDSTPRTMLLVTDNGPGFSPERLATAFDEGTTSKDDTHYGLGLSTVWRIVERCGGSLQIDSSASTGTSVSIGFQAPDTDDQGSLSHWLTGDATTREFPNAPTIAGDEWYPMGDGPDSHDIGDHRRL